MVSIVFTIIVGQGMQSVVRTLKELDAQRDFLMSEQAKHRGSKSTLLTQATVRIYLVCKYGG